MAARNPRLSMAGGKTELLGAKDGGKESNVQKSEPKLKSHWKLWQTGHTNL